MGKWTARLTEKPLAPPSVALTKLPKGPSVSFDSGVEGGCGPNSLAGAAIGAEPVAALRVPNTAMPSRPYRLTEAEADAAHAEPWDDAACARFVARVSLFLRRGINATDADDLAERLHLRDVQGDDRRVCLACRHLAGRRCDRRCGNHVAAGVGRDLPEVLMTQPQRCDGFKGVSDGNEESE